ncbi:MAG: nicotinate-nucleotide--dimethylbenzimidazole phosphoribosyltransferase [Alicyclobacillus herbarius]|uniref:nicotinate-nucleotide--dimethylbenzimidazole phosphoribosyltransferase n=1 Tax=Alicyclobacillus herbarius TaxID=122960 RepID=UPI0023563772|nr:nicotinate-nucleotide--dimethylbenzimidazole phosphoribosyltransferase [Alicyclobacillus herbarius]MCL6631910.1 nicotinate-nucleotide--dimethylbenzimidazole phosphoribosyltransferase [Alicyclobacillus herbarius]
MSFAIADVVAAVAPGSEAAAQRVETHLELLTKPPGSLGRLEALTIRLAAVMGSLDVADLSPVCLLFAADHGVAAEGVSAYPQKVTEQMVINIAEGGAVSSVLARQHGIPLEVVDVGVKQTIRHPRVVSCKVRPGTNNFVHGPAMTKADAEAAVRVGIERVMAASQAGRRFLLVGEMGIANTTAAAAMAAVLGEWTPAEVTGAGTGISDAQRAHKVKVIERAIAANQSASDPWEILACFGGFEIAALSGAILAAAAQRMPILLDGLMTGVAALWACRLAPHTRDYLIASHVSAEPGHRLVLQRLGIEPLLDLNLRLGEASGGLLAWPLIESALSVFRNTATFSSAGVSGPSVEW